MSRLYGFSFLKNDSRTLASKLKYKIPKKLRSVNLELKYYYIKYACEYGIQQRRGSTRSNMRDTKCKAEFSLSVSNDGQYLICKHFMEEHNHDLDAE